MAYAIVLDGLVRRLNAIIKPCRKCEAPAQLRQRSHDYNGPEWVIICENAHKEIVELNGMFPAQYGQTIIDAVFEWNERETEEYLEGHA